MTGSRLGRGRGGRLAVYGGCAVVLVLLVFLYRAATSEMSRLREVHVQCAHQQEALAAQLQVIFEYKVRLEKSLAEEKSSNAVLKQEIQQQATREKSLRDRNSIEAMQRFNSLQQSCKILETEHKDLQEECKKREKQALQDTRELHSRIAQAREDKDKALEKLKRKFFELGTQKEELEKRYNRILLNNTSTDGTIDHLKKEVFQLKRELAETKKLLHKFTLSDPNAMNSQLHQSANNGEPGSLGQPNVSPQQQQVSPPTNDDKSPRPLKAPAAALVTVDEPPQSNEQHANDANNVRFAQKNGNIVPVGPNEAKEVDTLPLPYVVQEGGRQKDEDPGGADENNIESAKLVDKNENGEDEQLKQVIPPPNQLDESVDDKKHSKSPGQGSFNEREEQLGEKKTENSVAGDKAAWLE